MAETGKVLLVYTNIDAPDGREVWFTEDTARTILGSPSYRIHESVTPEVRQRILPPPITADEWYNHLLRTYLSLCNCLSSKEKRDQLRAELHALKLLRLEEQSHNPSLKPFSEIPAGR